MLATNARLPGPPQLLPGRPDAIVDLQTHEGVAFVGGQWRHAPAHLREIDFVGPGADLGPSGVPNRTYDLHPHAEAVDFDDTTWMILDPPDTRRLSTGRVCFAWYRITVTIPPRVGEFDPTGATVVFEVVVDDYAEVWVNGALPIALGDTGGPVVAGFNAPNRVVLTDDARPGQRYSIAVSGTNGPVSASPRNYIWIRSATLDFYAPDRSVTTRRARLEVAGAQPGLDALVPSDTLLEQLATGFDSLDSPVWTPDNALLVSSPAMNTVYRWTPTGTVTVFRVKSGYTGIDIGRYAEPGASGLAFDPHGRLTICQHGNRRIIRVEPRGNTTVLAARFDGKLLNSPHALVYAANGTLYFTDPPIGLPETAHDPKRELPFSGVFRLAPDGTIDLVAGDLNAPTGIALSPNEKYLYVGDGDPKHAVVMRYRPDGSGERLADLTEAWGARGVGGITVDQGGNVYVCGPTGITILSPDSTRLGTIRLPEPATGLAWGDNDFRTLYLTTTTSIYRMRLRSQRRDST
jgi:gluconolactonase